MASNDQASWVKDGTSEAEPVTTVTPEVVEDVVEAKTEAAETTETVETDKPDEVTETKTEKVEEVAQKFIEGKLGDETFQLPEDVLIPQTRDGETGQPHTAHSRNAVPVILVNGPAEIKGLKHGRLADVAPTLLELLKLEPPAEMTGVSLVDNAGGPRAVIGERVSA